ncbi:hypothetical protein D3C87_1612700 [compost metagenome]
MAVKRYPAVHEFIARSIVHQADKTPCFCITGFVAVLHVVQLFQYLDGNGNIMLLKVFKGNMIVKDDRGIENEDFFFYSGMFGYFTHDA